MRNKLYLAAALQVFFSWVLPAQSTSLFQTTTPPSAGQPTGGQLSPTQFIGNYFVLNAPAHVDGLATAASVTDGGTIFGAIVSVANLNSLPTGSPFGTNGTSAPLATAVLRPNSTNAVVSSPVSVDLPAGTYVVVFGTGLFGATSGNASLEVSDGTKSSLPTGANQITYNQSCNGGTTNCWSNTFGAPSFFYFAVTGTSGLSTITALNPNFALPGGAAFTLTVNGTGFQSGSFVSWNGSALSTTYVSPTQLTASVPASLITTAGSANVTVTTQGTVSSNFPFTIGASSGPSISSLSPSGVTPGGNGFTLTVNGSGFQNGAIIQWNGTNLVTNFTSSSQLTAAVGPGLIVNSGIASITVLNPNNGGTSNAVSFNIGQVSSVPSITSLAPSSATAGSGTFTLTVNGTNFTAGSAILWNGALLPTTFVSSTQLTATVTSTQVASPATVSITVNTPNAGTSNTISFPITAASGPAITSLSPTNVAPGGPAFTLTVNGSNFVQGSAVLWNGGLLQTTFGSATQLTATVSAALIANAGTASVTVTNPGGSTSNAATFAVSATPPPTLSSLSPASASPGGPQFTLTVNGANFTSNSAVLWNGSLLATTFVNATQLTATVPSSLITSAGSANVTVTTTNAGTSNALPFTIALPTGPVISSLSPNSATPAGLSFIMTVNGSGFTQASLVQWNGNPIVTVYVSSTQLQASVSSNLIASAGTASVTVVSGSSTSNSVPFTIGASNTPILSSVSPNSATVGGPQFTLTANGSNFASGATITWNGGLLPTTFVSATQLTATVSASLIAAPGTATITVINPSGTNTTSNALTLPVTNAPQPSISALSPTTTAVGSPTFTLTVSGQGFQAGASVLWNQSALSTTFINSNQLTASVPASLLTAPGSANITVSNSGTVSNTLVFTITSSSSSTTLFQTSLPPTPGQPASAPLSTTQFLGNYFVLSAPAHIDSISTYALAQDGKTIFGAIVSVPNLTTAPSGNPFDGTTKATALLQPGTTSSIVSAPVSVDLPAGTYAIVFGSGYFGATSTQAYAANSNGASASVPAGWNQVSWGLYCGVNPCWAANFSGSSLFYFSITGTTTTAAGLTISSLSPAATTVGGPSFNLTVTGTGFNATSIVQWNGSSLPTTYVSPTQLTAAVSSGFIAGTGTASVTVVNSSGASTISNAATFTISSVVTAITSLSPTSATVGGPQFTLTVNGSGFNASSIVQWNGSSLATGFSSSGQLTATVPSSLLQTAGTAAVTVFTPGIGSSLPLSFAINAATPTITSLSPASVTLGSPAFTLTVNGSGFLSGATVLWIGAALPTTFVSGSQLTATVPASYLLSAGSASITVQNPGGAISNSTPFSVAPIGGGSTSAGLAHYAVGSNFTTGITIINTGASPAFYSISFFDDNGVSATLPFSTGSTNRLSGTLPAYGSAYFEAGNPNLPLTSGWGQISSDSSIVVQSLFRSTLNNTHYEAAVESSTGSKAFELPFDATNFAPGTPTYTGIAIANLDSFNTSTVTCTARDLLGNTIPSAVTIPSLRPLGHWAGFQFPLLTGYRGTLDCVSNTNVAVVALRFIGTDTFSSLPVIKK